MAGLGGRHLSNEDSNDRCRHDNGHIRFKPREYNGILESALWSFYLSLPLPPAMPRILPCRWFCRRHGFYPYRSRRCGSLAILTRPDERTNQVPARVHDTCSCRFGSSSQVAPGACLRASRPESSPKYQVSITRSWSSSAMRSNMRMR